MAITFDKYGHCVNCHKNMLITQVVDQKEITRLTGEYTEVEYMLNDGSKMRVACCINCKDTIKDNNHPEIMDTVFKGWEKEIEKLNWSEQKKKAYFDEFSKKRIVCPTEGKGKDVLNQELDNFSKAIEAVKAIEDLKSIEVK